MRILGSLVLCVVMATPTLAAGRGGYHGGGGAHVSPAYHGGGYRSAPRPAMRAPSVFNPAVRAHRTPYGLPPRYNTTMRQRAISAPHGHAGGRHIRMHGGNFYVPAIVATGAPVLLDVPGIGAVSVDESRYQDLYQQLASDDAEMQERAWRELQEIKQQSQASQPAPQFVPQRPSGPTNMVPPGYGTARAAASADNVDLAERISFSDPPAAQPSNRK